MSDYGAPLDLDATMELQRRCNLASVHVASIGPGGFHLAHTDDERQRGWNTPDCPVHRWLTERDEQPAPTGLYVVTDHAWDAYSESYPVPAYDLHPLEDDTPVRRNDEHETENEG